MKHLKIFLFILILLVLPVLVSAKVITPSIVETDSGFEIVVPLIDAHQVNTEYVFYWHLINKTNGAPIRNETTQCGFHLYNGNGGYIYQRDNIVNMDSAYDWEIVAPATNFTEVGHYNYIVQCNSSTLNQGGFVSDGFYVTLTGDIKGENNGSGSIALLMFLVFITGGLFGLSFIVGNFTKNQYSDLILKRSCWLISIYLLMFDSAIMAQVVDRAGLALTQEMFRFMWFFGTAGYLFMGYLVFKTLLDTIALWKISGEEKRMGKEGDDEDGF